MPPFIKEFNEILVDIPNGLSKINILINTNLNKLNSLFYGDQSENVIDIFTLINNVVIFRTDKDSNHGFPDNILCPKNVNRKSIAIYYYIEEKSFFPIKIKMRKYYTTHWKKRPNSNDPEFMDQDNLWRRIKYKYLPSFIIKRKK